MPEYDDMGVFSLHDLSLNIRKIDKRVFIELGLQHK